LISLESSIVWVLKRLVNESEIKYPSLNLNTSETSESYLIGCQLWLPFSPKSFHLQRVLVISTNSFYEFNTPNCKVYFLFLGEYALLPWVLL
jgi:hypothetical protein